MHTQNRTTFYIALFAVMLALTVILLGAYTRLKDAGLGCPDWPGCYGHVIAPDSAKTVQQAETSFPGQMVNETKAWTEMTHRYIAGTLGVLVLVTAFLTLRKRKLPYQPIGLACALLVVIVCQALLGKWTVTLRLLPVVVMGHLLGGMLLLSLLWTMTMRLGGFFRTANIRNAASYKPWALLGLAIVAAQILLGGWTSANYAALVCPDFPYCQGHLMPPLNFHTAFQFWMNIGPNFQGGVLDNTARVTIHMMHRVGALVTFLYITAMAIYILCKEQNAALRNIATVALIVLFAQIFLGISNVVWMLPLPVSVAHNGVAALLLLTMVTLNYALWAKPKHQMQF